MVEKNNIKTQCPLISERKIIKEKCYPSIISFFSIEIMKYDKKDFILIGHKFQKFEIYDSNNLDLIISNSQNINDKINNIGQLTHETFAVISSSHIFIFFFYSEYDDFSKKEMYKIQLIQSIKSFPTKNIFNYINFKKAFILNKNLFKDFYSNDTEEKFSKEKNYDINELVVSSDRGIIIYEKKVEDDEELKNSDINAYIDKCIENQYIYKRPLTHSKNYDIVQINYKLIAGTTYRGLNLYSMKKYELITRFEVEISKNCDNIIYMVNEDILCLGGNSTITLLSIKSFEIVFKYSILNNFYITEICILSDYNILVAMHGNKNNMEYFYQYKYRNKMNESTNKKDSKLEEVSYKLVTEKDSNVTMKCLSDNRLISIINYNKIQIWK